jgi:hypothetical protein
MVWRQLPNLFACNVTALGAKSPKTLEKLTCPSTAKPI